MQKNLKINELTVKSFRGINDEISLNLDNITILKGENGTGKSSFVNAIEYLFSNELSFLKNNTINSLKSSIHKDSTKNDVKIELKFRKNRFIKFENFHRSNSEFFDEILKDSYINNASFILTRKKLLEFIDGTQGNRYKAMMGLLGIDKLDKIQSILSASASTFQRDLENRILRYDEKLSDLSLLVSEDSNLKYDECIEKVNEILINNSKDTVNENTDIEKFLSNLNLADYKVISEKITKFKEIYHDVNIDDISLELNKLLKEYEEIASENLKVSQSLVNTLNASLNYIEITNSETCPVCENEIDPDFIKEKISLKIEDINKTNLSFINWKNKIDELINKLDIQLKNCDNCNDIITDLNGYFEEKLSLLDYNVLINLKNDLLALLKFDKVVSDFKSIDLTKIITDIKNINEKIDEYEKNQNINDLSNIYNMLFKIMELKQLNHEIIDLSMQLKASNTTLDVFVKTKEEFVNNIILDIKNDIKNYYNFIHEDDLISSPDIIVSGPKKIDVYLDSFGSSVDSRSYASEGHLDTLGICIFLAFNKKFNKLPLIVLDDVFTTVDLPHKGRLAKLIVEKLSDYQFFITTHSPLWAEHLKRLCIASSKSYTLYEIIDWSLDEGPIISKPLDIESRIHKYLNSDHKDLKAAGNAARRYLEYILTEICLANNVKVPINDKYDVNTLFEPAKKQTIARVTGTNLEAYYKHIWKEINGTRYIANELSHYNDTSDSIPKNDVIKFCDDVINLKRAFTCDCGKSFLILDKESKKLICTHKKCRDSIDMNSFPVFVDSEIGESS